MDKLNELTQQLPAADEDDERAEIVDQDTMVYSGVLWKVRHRFTTVEWKERHGALFAKQLCYYKGKSDKQPKQVVSVEGCTIVFNPENADCPPKEFSFALTHPQRKTVYLAATDQSEMTEWTNALEKTGVKISHSDGKGMQTQRVAFSSRGAGAGGGPKKMNLRTRTEKYLATKAVTAKVGIDIIETFFGETGVELIETLHEFVSTQSGEETAATLEANTLKMAAKIAVLVKNGVITDEQLVPIMPVVLRWCKTFIALYGAYGGARHVHQKQQEQAAQLIDDGGKIEEWIQELIKPHLRDRSTQRVKTVFQYYLDEDLLNTLSLNENYATTQVLLDNVIRLYHKIYEGDTDFEEGQQE